MHPTSHSKRRDYDIQHITKSDMAQNDDAYSIDSGFADPFSSLCGLTTFVTNSSELLKIDRKLTPAQVAALCSLLTSTASISRLTLWYELPPGAAAAIGSAISASTVCELALGDSNALLHEPAPELLRILASVSAGSAMEQLSITCFDVDDERVCDSLWHLAALRSLTIATDRVSSRCVPLIVAGIGKLRALESLHLKGVLFPDFGAGMLTAALNDLPMVTDISIRAGGLSSGRTIGNLVALRRIQKLDLHGNLLYDKGVSEIVDTILASKRRIVLQMLNLGSNWVGPVGGQKVAELIARLPRLRTLDLSCNPIGEGFRLMRAGQAMEELDLSTCKMDVHGIESLLSAGAALSVIRIGGNYVRDLGAQAVAQFILRLGGRKLYELRMEDNEITETGALALAKACVKAYALQHIDMAGNLIGPHGAATIMNALVTASMVPMDTIRFWQCNIGDDGAPAAGRLIIRRGCRHLYLGNNNMHAKAAKMIADSVAASACSIQLLDLSYNPFGDRGVKCLLKMITLIPQQRDRILVHELDIVETEMGVKGAMAVRRVVESHCALIKLRVSINTGNEKADKIVKDAGLWERNSKSLGTAILDIR